VKHRLSRHPITVVLLGTDRPPTLAKRTMPADRTLVYMGTFMPYKNVDVLVRGMALLPGYRLLLMSRVTPAERARLEALAPAGSLQFFDGASDEDYQAALRGATALVTASKDEGFGLPLVEAMAVGTPLVVSDIPIFREIGGDVAAYFEVTSPESFANAVTALEDGTLWSWRSVAARERSALFDWDIAAAALLTVLEETYAKRSAHARDGR
jgi:glycosyltransferase involved in cell wall biosynthesis